MRKIVKIAQREYAATVKTKTFVIGVLVAPAIVVGIVFFTSRMAKDKGGPRPALNVAITDLSGELEQELRSSFDDYNESHDHRPISPRWVEADETDLERVTGQQKERLRERRLDMYVMIEKDAITSGGKVLMYAYKSRASDFDVPDTIEGLINRAVVNRRCEMENVSPELLRRLRRRVSTEYVNVGSAEGKEKVEGDFKRFTKMMVPFFFMYLMFLGIMLTAQHMLTSVIEEKSSRVMEVLLSAVSPFELLAGKIFGLAGLGLTLMGLWAAVAYGGAVWKGLTVEVNAEIVVWFVVYFVLGFLLFSALLAAIGSICNTLKEAQGLMTPVTLVFIVPLLAWFNMVRDPQGALARALSFFPLTAPLVMVLRLSASDEVKLIEIAASVAVLVVSLVIVMWAGAKVFRTGILMYGKRPKLREVVHWLRQS